MRLYCIVNISIRHVLQSAEQLPTAASMAHLYAVNAGVQAEDYGGNLDVTIQHNDNTITQLRTRIELMGVGARGRGDVSERMITSIYANSVRTS